MQSGKLDGGVKSIQKTCFETIKGKTRTINKQIETVKVETSGNIASMWAEAALAVAGPWAKDFWEAFLLRNLHLINTNFSHFNLFISYKNKDKKQIYNYYI
jgi:hypothetical protein